jgi:hypothetical protein
MAVMFDRHPSRKPGLRSARPLARFAAALCLALGLGACSSVDLIYAVADDMVESRAERYLDLSDPADALHMEQTVDALFEARTRTLTPKISAFLNDQADLLERAEPSPSRDEVADGVERFRALLREAASGAAPYIAAVLVRHTTPERVAHLEAALAERHAEKVEDYADLSPADYRAERIDRTVDGIERFVPDLTAEQTVRVAAVVDAEIARGGRGRWLDNMAAKDAALVAFLRTGPDQDAVAAFMTDWFTASWRVADPDFKRHSDAWWESRADLLFTVIETMTPEQKAETVRTLRAYARDIAGLTS